MTLLTNELIDSILRVVNTNARTTLSRGSISVAVMRNMLVEAGCIALCGDTDYTRREDSARAAIADAEAAAPSGCTDCSGDAECLDDVQDADNPNRASYDDHEVCIVCGNLTTCNEDNLCWCCGG